MWNAIRRIKALVLHGADPLEEERHRWRRLNPFSARNYFLNNIPSDPSILSLNKLNTGEGDDMESSVMAKLEMDTGDTVKPDDDVAEDPQTKALRLFRFKILYMACNMDPDYLESSLDRMDPKFRPSPDYDTVQVCRLVCKSWNEEISTVFRSVGKSVVVVNPLGLLQKKKKPTPGQIQTYEPSTFLDMLMKPLVRPSDLQPPHSNLPVPPIKLVLPSGFFYKEIENRFVYSAWTHFQSSLYEINLSLPVDSTMKFYWPHMNLTNLKKMKFKCTNDTRNPNKLGGFGTFHYNPFNQGGNYTYLLHQMISSAPNLETLIVYSSAPHYTPALFRIPLTRGIAELDLPLVQMSEEEMMDCSETVPYFNDAAVKRLTIRAPLRPFNRDDGVTGCHSTFLIQKYLNTLESLTFDVAGQEWDHIIWRMRSDYVYDPLRVDFTPAMNKLTSLNLHAGIWEINGMKSYEEQLPALKSLTLTLITKESQIKDLYSSKSTTVEKLVLSFINTMPYEVLRGFADNFPNLKELDVILKDSEPGLNICFQGFPKLTRLKVICNSCNSDEGLDALRTTITGIPIDKYKLIESGEITVLDAIKTYGDYTSLRNLTDLKELRLIVRSNSSIDISLMLRTTFLRMPKLKKLVLSDKVLTIDEEQRDFVRKENVHGLVMQWK